MWLSDEPLDCNEGAEGDTVLEITLASTEAAIQEFEWVEEGKTYREWLVPAATLNPLIESIRIVPDSELGELSKRW